MRLFVTSQWCCCRKDVPHLDISRTISTNWFKTNSTDLCTHSEFEKWTHLYLVFLNKTATIVFHVFFLKEEQATVVL